MPLDDTNWKPETETKPNVFSLESLIAWLELQPPETTYDFFDCDGGCLIGRYLRATTGKHWPEHGLSWKAIMEYYPSWNEVSATWPHIYSAALSRARALLASRPKE